MPSDPIIMDQRALKGVTNPKQGGLNVVVVDCTLILVHFQCKLCPAAAIARRYILVKYNPLPQSSLSFWQSTLTQP